MILVWFLALLNAPPMAYIGVKDPAYLPQLSKGYWQFPVQADRQALSDFFVAHVDMVRLGQYLKNESSWQKEAEIFRRLGFLQARSLHIQGREGVLTMQHDPQGLGAIWGTSKSVRIPKQLPLGTRFIEMSIKPEALDLLLERVFAGISPLEYTALRLQFAEAEKMTGESWLDALGSEPQLLNIWHLHKTAIVCGVHNGKAMWKILEAMLPAFEIVHAQVKKQKPRGKEIARMQLRWQKQLWNVIIEANKVIFTNDMKWLQKVSKQPFKTLPEEGVAYGVIQNKHPMVFSSQQESTGYRFKVDFKK